MALDDIILNTNPILVTIGNLEIRWYSALILAAVFIVLKIAETEAGRFKIRKDFIFNLLFWSLIVGIIGARLYYVLFSFDKFKDDPISILYVWKGGLAIHGGLIAALITVVAYCKKYNVRVIRILDIICVPLLLGQAIGRWGNFFNGEAFGAATSAETLKRLMVPQFIIDGMTDQVGNVYQPTFFYESVVCFVAFLILALIRRGKYIKVGTMTASYLMIYGVLRFFIETSRQDALMVGGFKAAQIVSVVMFIIGLGIMMFVSRKGKFEDLYNDPSNSTDIKF